MQSAHCARNILTISCHQYVATHYFGNNLYIKLFEIDILLLANALLVNTYTLFHSFVGFVYLSVGLMLNILGFLIGFFRLVLEVLDSDSITFFLMAFQVISCYFLRLHFGLCFHCCSSILSFAFIMIGPL